MTGAFTQAAIISFREGLEAALLLGALTVYVTRLGAARHMPAIYGGALLAAILSTIAAVLLAGARAGPMPLFDGTLAIVAALLMMSVSGWLWARRERSAFADFVSVRARRAALPGGGVMVAALAFTITLREGVEIAVFALALGRGGHEGEIVAGLASGAAILALAFAIVRTLSMRLPLRMFLSVTSAGLFVIALVLIGEGVAEFQEVDAVSTTPLNHAGSLAALGLNASWEAVNRANHGRSHWP